MSTDYDDPLLWEDEPTEAPPPPVITLGTAQNLDHKRTKTLAEALVDAVQGITDTPKVHTCSCGHTEWKTLSSGLDGRTQKQCKKCRVRVPWSTTSAPMHSPIQSRAGPFAGGTVAASTPFTPTFKR